MKRKELGGRIFAAAAAAALAVSGGSLSVLAAEAEPAITEAGSLSDPDKALSFSAGMIRKSVDNENEQLYSALGEAVEGSDFLYGEPLNGNPGYVVLTKKGELCGISALYAADGTELIPYGPAMIEHMADSDRFVKVYYIEEETENKEEAILYTTSSRFSLQPKEGDRLFTGNIQVYDLETRKFVENIRLTKPQSNIESTGETLLITADDGTEKIYDCDGKVLCENADNVNIQRRFYTASVDGGLIVYDAEYNRLCETGNSVNAIGKRTDCLQYVNEDGKRCVMDTAGKTLLETESTRYLDGEADTEVFEITREDGDEVLHGLLNPDGSALVEPQFTSMSYCGNGYYYGTKKGEDSGYAYTLISAQDGILCENTENLNTQFVTEYKENDASRTYFVVDDRDYTLELENASPIAFGLVKARDASGMWGLFDTITGEQVLDYEYMDIQTAYDMIYAYKDGEYTVYDVNR